MISILHRLITIWSNLLFVRKALLQLQPRSKTQLKTKYQTPVKDLNKKSINEM